MTPRQRLLRVRFACDYPGNTLPPWLGYYSYTEGGEDKDLERATLEIKLMTDHVVTPPQDTFHIGVPFPDKHERAVDLALSGRAGVTQFDKEYLYSCPVYRVEEKALWDEHNHKSKSEDRVLVGVLIGKRNVNDGYVFSLPKNARRSREPSRLRGVGTSMQSMITESEDS